MKVFWMIAVLILVAALVSLAVAQPAPAPAATNQPLSDAVKQAEAAKDIKTALAKATELEASSLRDGAWVENTRKVAVLMWKSGKHAEAEAWLKDKAAALPADTDGLSPDTRNARAQSIANACADVALSEPDSAVKLDLARLGLSVDGKNIGAFGMLFNALAAAGKPDDALQACIDYADKVDSMEHMRARRMTLLTSLKRTDALKAEALEYLKISTDPLSSAKAFGVLLPADDASLCCGLSAQQLLDGYKAMLRARDARVNVQVLLNLTDQLTKGGDARPLVVTDQAKALADKLTNAPLSAFLVPLLKGDYAAAVKEGYARAKASAGDAEYTNWVNGTAGAIRCMDQAYNGRALDFIKFINGTTDVNPVAGVIGP